MPPDGMGGGGGAPPPEDAGPHADAATPGDFGLIADGGAPKGGGEVDTEGGSFAGAFLGAIFPKPFLGAFLGGGGGGGPDEAAPPPGEVEGPPESANFPLFGGAFGAVLAGGANLGGDDE